MLDNNQYISSARRNKLSPKLNINLWRFEAALNLYWHIVNLRLSQCRKKYISFSKFLWLKCVQLKFNINSNNNNVRLTKQACRTSLWGNKIYNCLLVLKVGLFVVCRFVCLFSLWPWQLSEIFYLLFLP